MPVFLPLCQRLLRLKQLLLVLRHDLFLLHLSLSLFSGCLLVASAFECFLLSHNLSIERLYTGLLSHVMILRRNVRLIRCWQSVFPLGHRTLLFHRSR